MSQNPAAPPVALIAAVAENNVIGRGGDLPWHLPDDLRFFKRKTQGQPVIMGRRTYESLGGALPNRHNILVTRRDPAEFPALDVAPSLEQAIERARQHAGPAGEIFIAGGQQLYAEALPLADRLYITRVHARPQGDTCFPAFDPSDWQLIEQHDHPADADHDYAFTFLTYHRQ